jgi:hypothetical protein
MSDTTVTEREEKALVTIETAERLAAKAIQAIGFGRLNEAQAYLEALIDHTTTRTVTAVKDQALSDRIAHDAINDVQVVTLKVKTAKLEEDTPVPVREAAARVAEFARQWQIPRSNGESIHSIHFDAAADEVDLTVRDLTTLVRPFTG